MASERTLSSAGLILVVSLGLAGCVIDVDLTSSPQVVVPGKPVRFDVAVTNRGTCPVGGIVSLLFPFVPRNYFIDQMDNPELRQTLSDAADALCTNRSYQFPDAQAGCRIEAGELICEIGGVGAWPAEEPVAAPGSLGVDQVTCQNTGSSIICRVPESLYADALRAATAESEESLGSLQCVVTPNDIVVCGALFLDPNETKSDSVSMVPDEEGAYRNWVLSFASVAGGVACAAAVWVPFRGRQTFRANRTTTAVRAVCVARESAREEPTPDTAVRRQATARAARVKSAGLPTQTKRKWGWRARPRLRLTQWQPLRCRGGAYLEGWVL